MISRFYHLLESLGYAHPLHPPLTHLPIGLVALVFLAAGWSFLSGRHLLSPRACYRISLVALVFLVATVVAGFADWRYFYDGAWLFEIKVKYALTGVLLLTLIGAAVLGYSPDPRSKRNLALYLVAFLTLVGLGYFGAQLVFQEVSSEAPKAFRHGEKLFARHCGECHDAAGVAGSRYVRTADVFVRFLRDPSKAAGTSLPMPAFREAELSRKAAEQIRGFVGVSGCVQDVKAGRAAQRRP